MQLEALHAQRDGPVHTVEEIVLVLTGQPGHEVPADQQPGIQRGAYGLFGLTRRVPAIDAAQGVVPAGLEAQLQPDLVQPAAGQQGQLFPVQAVRPRAHGDAPAAGQGRHLFQQVRQPGGRAVGIGKGLQIGHEQAVTVRGGVFGVPGIPLGAQVETAQAHAGTGAAVVAEDAAPRGERAVPVGAGGARIQWNFLHPDAVFAPEIGGQGMPKQHDSRLFSGFFRAADRRKNLYCVRNSLTSSPF